MTTQVLEFLKLSNRDRRKADTAAKLGRTLKTKLDAQQEALDALAEDTELLMRDHGL